MSIKKGFVESTAWMLASRVLQQVVLLARLALLARLLDPADFGLMGVALLTIATLEVLTVTGFQEALIHKGKGMAPYMATAWTVLIARSLCLYGILFLMAPSATVFFGAPEATTMVRVAGLSVIFFAFRNIHLVKAQSELRYRKVFIVEVAALAADFAISVVLAVMFRSAWALIIGMVTGKLAYSIASYMVSAGRPHLDWDWRKAGELFHFGKWLLGSSMLIYCYTQLDSVIIGRLLGPTALGVYMVGQRVSLLPVRQFSIVIGQVSFPAMSHLNRDPAAMRKAYLRIVGINTFIILPVTFILLLYAGELVSLVLSSKWGASAPVITIFSMMVLLTALNVTAGPLFNAAGTPRDSVVAQLIKMLTMLALIYPLVQSHGLIGAPLAALAGELAATPYLMWRIWRICALRPGSLVSAAGYPFVAAGICYSIPALLRDHAGWEFDGFLPLGTALGTASILYLGVMWLVDVYTNHGGFRDLLEIRRMLLARS